MLRGNKVRNRLPYFLVPFYHRILPLLASFLGISGRKYEQGNKIKNVSLWLNLSFISHGSWRTELLLSSSWDCACIGDCRVWKDVCFPGRLSTLQCCSLLWLVLVVLRICHSLTPTAGSLLSPLHHACKAHFVNPCGPSNSYVTGKERKKNTYPLFKFTINFLLGINFPSTLL